MSALRCPLCQSNAWAVGRGAAGYAVVCRRDDCRTTGPLRVTEEAAIAAWNRRAGDDEVEKLRAELAAAREALKECADELEAYIMREYSGNVLTPGNALRRARDLAVVDAARTALGDTP